MKLTHSASIGLTLLAGGVTILAVHRVFSLSDAVIDTQSLTLTLGAIAGYCMFGLGVFTLLGGRSSGGQPEAPLATVAAPRPLTPPASALDLDLSRTLATFDEWIENMPEDVALWPAFDQLVREMMTAQLQARRTRCYHIAAGAETLAPLTEQIGADAPPPLNARQGILGHVATSGKPYNRSDAGHGELVHRLAGEDETPWQLAWPMRVEGRTVGVVALNELPTEVLHDRPRCDAARRAVQVLWRHVLCYSELRVARTTDKATGVLTREDFFAAAEAALDASRELHEPVVVMALSLEGLRGLDDSGRWTQRDHLIEQIGNALLRRVRRDDVVGRFSDDRFIVMLRRVDSGLGRLIAQKTHNSVSAILDNAADLTDRVRTRIGLGGSGLADRDLHTLLRLAFGAAEAARRHGETIRADIPADLSEGAGA